MCSMCLFCIVSILHLFEGGAVCKDYITQKRHEPRHTTSISKVLRFIKMCIFARNNGKTSCKNIFFSYINVCVLDVAPPSNVDNQDYCMFKYPLGSWWKNPIQAPLLTLAFPFQDLHPPTNQPTLRRNTPEIQSRYQKSSLSIIIFFGTCIYLLSSIAILGSYVLKKQLPLRQQKDHKKASECITPPSFPHVLFVHFGQAFSS